MSTQGLENAKKVALAEYDFDKDGGAIGDITLRGANIPKGAIITGGIIHVITALTSGGSATVALKVQTTADILAATAIASLSEDALLDTIPVHTAATSIRLTANRDIIATVAVETITAGKFVVVLEYVITE